MTVFKVSDDVEIGVNNTVLNQHIWRPLTATFYTDIHLKHIS